MSRDKPKKKPDRRAKEATAKTPRSSDEVNALRARMVEVKERLPKGAVTKFISVYSEYSNYSKSSRVRLVFNLSIVDEAITDKFEALADLIEREQSIQIGRNNQNNC